MQKFMGYDSYKTTVGSVCSTGVLGVQSLPSKGIEANQPFGAGAGIGFTWFMSIGGNWTPDPLPTFTTASALAATSVLFCDVLYSVAFPFVLVFVGVLVVEERPEGMPTLGPVRDRVISRETGA